MQQWKPSPQRRSGHFDRPATDPPSGIIGCIIESFNESFFPPADGEVLTIVVGWPPGDPGLPPHGHPGGSCFGYILEGEMVVELEQTGWVRRSPGSST